MENMCLQIDGQATYYYSINTELKVNLNEIEDLTLHRLDGPAVEYIDGDKLWYYYGKLIDCKSQEEFEHLIKLKVLW